MTSVFNTKTEEPHITAALITFLRDRYPVGMALNAKSYDELQYVKGAQDLILFMEIISKRQQNEK